MNNPTPLDPDGEIDEILTVLCSRARLAYKSDAPFKNQAHAKDEAKSRLLEMLREARRKQTQKILDLTKSSYLAKAPVANIENITNNMIAANNSVCLGELEQLKEKS